MKLKATVVALGLAVCFTAQAQVSKKECEDAIAYGDTKVIQSDERCVRYQKRLVEQKEEQQQDARTMMILCATGGRDFDSMCGRQRREPTTCRTQRIGNQLYTTCE